MRGGKLETLWRTTRATITIITNITIKKREHRPTEKYDSEYQHLNSSNRIPSICIEFHCIATTARLSVRCAFFVWCRWNTIYPIA